MTGSASNRGLTPFLSALSNAAITRIRVLLCCVCIFYGIIVL